ncbi:hypothetical protein DV515_00011259, partial [Chloebia gouldiae]
GVPGPGAAPADSAGQIKAGGGAAGREGRRIADVPLELSDMSLLSSVAEARQLVDAAYKRTREQ